MRSVKLEILRRGPAHNQLLSPLTEYIALVGDHPPTMVRVSTEHAAFLARLGGLRYASNPKVERRLAMEEAGQVVSHLLGQIPALSTELGAQPGTPVQLRLVLSGLELAMLPFELALSPEGFPGSQQHLFRQDVHPVYLTREARRGQERELSWPERPRVLYAFSGAGGPVPFRAHLAALGRAIEPWLGWHADRAVELPDHLKILSNASLASIQEACSKEAFTHVHILCHGAALPHAPDRFGLAFFQADLSGVEVADGEQVAAALSRGPGGMPAVVTLASCDSGAVGTVLSGEAGVAHALHAAGVPLVVASQFPLSSKGSTLFVEAFYRAVLYGRDPRVALHDVRRVLFAQAPTDHDWASLVVYATLPKNIDKELPMVELRRHQKAGDVLLERFRRAGEKGEDPPNPKDLDRVMRQVERFLEQPATRKKAHGWLAAAAIRWAVDIELPGAGWPIDQPGSQDGGYRPLSICNRSLALQRAVHHYQRAYAAEPLDMGPAVGEVVARALLAEQLGVPDPLLEEDLRMIKRSCLRLLPYAASLEGAHSQIALHGYLGLMSLLLGEDALGHFRAMVDCGTTFHFTCFSNGRSIRRLARCGPAGVRQPAEEAWKMLKSLGVPEFWTEATSWWKNPSGGGIER